MALPDSPESVCVACKGKQEGTEEHRGPHAGFERERLPTAAQQRGRGTHRGGLRADALRPPPPRALRHRLLRLLRAVLHLHHRHRRHHHRRARGRRRPPHLVVLGHQPEVLQHAVLRRPGLLRWSMQLPYAARKTHRAVCSRDVGFRPTCFHYVKQLINKGRNSTHTHTHVSENKHSATKHPRERSQMIFLHPLGRNFSKNLHQKTQRQEKQSPRSFG